MIPLLKHRFGLSYFLQILPEPGRIYQKDIYEKQCAQWKKKNGQVQQKDSDANQNPVGDTHYNSPLSFKMVMDLCPIVVALVKARVR